MTTRPGPKSDALIPSAMNDTLPPRSAEDLAVLVRLEFAKYIEKRDAIRRSSSKPRRSILETQLS